MGLVLKGSNIVFLNCPGERYKSLMDNQQSAVFNLQSTICRLCTCEIYYFYFSCCFVFHIILWLFVVDFLSQLLKPDLIL